MQITQNVEVDDSVVTIPDTLEADDIDDEILDKYLKAELIFNTGSKQKDEEDSPRLENVAAEFLKKHHCLNNLSSHGQNASDGKARDSTTKEVLGKMCHPNLHKLLVWQSNQETMEG
ncbi:hypothetical protein MHU86_6894 [Fragilaria crotonensis]|nr:hypothetical protein MHU86_6894 [Fragilaria crotonensis]